MFEFRDFYPNVYYMELAEKNLKNYDCKICDYNTSYKHDLEKHFLTKKHLEKMSNDKNPKKKCKVAPKIFNCEKCKFITNNKNNFEKHILTNKHLDIMSEDKNPKKMQRTSEKTIVSYNCEKCNYLTKSKKDYIKHLDTQKHVNICLLYEKHKKEIIVPPDDLTMKTMFIEIMKQNTELQHTVIELSKIKSQDTTIATTNNNNNNNNNNNTTNNTTNNQFNLQFFLNDTCKDAMNIDEFINSLKVTMEDFENTGKLGYVEGITRIIINGLNQVDTTKRPIHCTDVKRETVYIKSDDSWEKENPDKEKLKKAVKQVARMNLSQLPTWQRENPASEVLDTREHCQYVKYSLAALGGVGDRAEEQNIDKIMRNVIKETIVDKK